MNFITGHGFSAKADYVLNEKGFCKNTYTDLYTNKLPIFFVKTDYIDVFFNNPSLLPNQNFILITHNSDYSINNYHSLYLEYPYLQKWYAQNVDYDHIKLIPIPIGIANPEWPHGNISTISSIIESKYFKDHLIYANFNTHTNPLARQICLENIPTQYIDNRVSFDVYLSRIAKAYFNICPMGNGIDSHRIWESLYLKTIPVVEHTYNIDTLKKRHNLPVLILDSWHDIPKIQFTESLYNSIWNNFDTSKLDIDYFLEN